MFVMVLNYCYQIYVKKRLMDEFFDWFGSLFIQSKEAAMKNKLQQFWLEMFKMGNVRGFQHFSMYLRGKEEMGLTVNHAPEVCVSDKAFKKLFIRVWTVWCVRERKKIVNSWVLHSWMRTWVFVVFTDYGCMASGINVDLMVMVIITQQ